MKTAKFILLFLCLSNVFMSALSYSNFWNNFYVNFGKSVTRFTPPNNLQLALTRQTGSGFVSKSPYLFGYVAMKVKLVSGNSAGIVTSYYLSSTYKNHCELDFEFLGNVSGQPYLLQTNVFVEGVGNREQRITLWFDPSKEFHTYGILWNKDLVLFFVDNTAIRVFQNLRYLNVPYLDYQEMYSYSSIFDGSSWATRGGRDKIDWAHSPFYASYTDFDIEACRVAPGPYTLMASKHNCYSQVYKQPYGSHGNRTLTTKQWNDLKWIQTKYLTYDYCTDKTRWTTQPIECSKNWPKKW